MTMRKSAQALTVVLAACFSTAALAAKKKAPPPDPAIQAQKDTAAFLGALGQSEPSKVKPKKKKG